jgi:hypothetical protein
MALFPVIMLIGGAVLMWLVRSRSARLGWGIGASAAAIAWMGSLLVLRGLPIRTNISVWQPVELFAAQIEMVIDVASAKVIVAGTTVVLAIILSTAVELADKTFRLRPALLLYAAVGLIAMLSANLLTVALSWALIDVLSLIYELTTERESSGTSNLLARLLIGLSGVFAVIGAAIVNAHDGGVDDLAAPFNGYWATAILVIAVMLRMGLARPGSALDGNREHDKAFVHLAGIMPQAAAVVVLARQFAFDIPAELVVALRLMCVAGIAWSGIRWALGEEREDSLRFLNYGLVFVGILVSTAVPARGDAPLSSAIAIMLILGTLSRIVHMHSPWQRAVPIIGVLIMIMPGWTTGSLLIQGIATCLELEPSIWISLMSIAGLGLMAAGILRDVFKKTRIWYVDDLARLLYSLGLLLPLMIGFGLGGGTGAGVGIRSAIVAVLIAAVAAAGFAWMRRREREIPQKVRETSGRRGGESIMNAGLNGLRWMSGSLRAFGELMEGEGAMLWIFVILLLIQLGIGGSAP